MIIFFVAASGNNVYVVWHDGTSDNNEILFRRSTNSGATFGATVNLSINAGISLHADVVAAGNNVYIVWRDNLPGNDEILYGNQQIVELHLVTELM